MTGRTRKTQQKDMSYRRRRRARNHAEAMGDDHATVEVPAHPLIPSGKPSWARTAAEVDEIVAHIRETGTYAYDTEFIGELSYYPKICVIQLATPERLVLVDPLEDLDLTPIWELIADEDVRTIVHAGVQDLEPVVRFLDRAPANVTDTQLCAAFIGQPYPVSLRKLVLAAVDVRLGKALTFTQWDQRPLSKHHQSYAADDVRYLLAVQSRIDERLRELDHEAWARSECAQLERRELYRVDLETQYRRLRGAETLDARQATILRRLFALRDELAREQDVPPRTMLKDELLVRIARDRLREADKLMQLRGMPRPTIERFGTRFIKAVEQGLEDEPVSAPSRPRHDESTTERFRIDGLLAAAGACCLGRSIDPSLVLTRADVAGFYRRIVAGRDVSDHRLMRGWRREVVGSVLRSLMDGDLDLIFRWRDGALHMARDERVSSAPPSADCGAPDPDAPHDETS